MAESKHIVVAFSGGKDSTALALRLNETGVRFRLLNTPTGNELPGVREHIERIANHTGAELVDLKAPTLAELIEEQKALPNWRMRWCTRMIKIEPCAEWLNQHNPITLAVGLRADEQGRAGATYSGSTEVVCPLRDWGWNEIRVREYVLRKGFQPPKRTDCAVCFYQTLYEWYELWMNHGDYYKQGIFWEDNIGHTFRSPGRDAWPASLRELAKEFMSGHIPKPRQRKVMCRVCST